MAQYQQFERLQRRHLQAGECIFWEGEPGDFAYIIEEGEVEIYTVINGERHVLNTLKPGSMFGELALVDGRARSASAIARQATLLTVITPEQVERRIETADPILRLLLLVVMRHFRSETRHFRALPEDKETHSPLFKALAEMPTRITNAVDLIRMESELRAAVDQEQFQLFYQPIVELEKQTIAGFEALIRWHSPSRGFVRPDVFIGLAESTSLILPIGQWCFVEGCHGLQKLSDLAQRPLFISFNIAGLQIEEPNFVQNLLDPVNQNHLQPSQIKLEILERSLVDIDTAIQWVKDCRAAGFFLALDDFGTGYSSLEYLQDYQLDTLKIDKAFVRQLADNPHSRSICKTIIDLAHSLSMTTVAEGVETKLQMQILRSLGCTYGQGYFFAKPLPLEQALDIVSKNFSD